MPQADSHSYEASIEVTEWWRKRRMYYNFASMPTRANILPGETAVGEPKITLAVAKRKLEAWKKLKDKF
jgi:hypothetical protein